MATEITGDTPKYLTLREVLEALLRGDVVQCAHKQDAENPSHLWSVVNPERAVIQKIDSTMIEVEE